MNWIETQTGEYINGSKVSMMYVEDYGDDYRKPFAVIVKVEQTLIEVAAYEHETSAYEHLKQIINELSV